MTFSRIVLERTEFASIRWFPSFSPLIAILVTPIWYIASFLRQGPVSGSGFRNLLPTLLILPPQILFALLFFDVFFVTHPLFFLDSFSFVFAPSFSPQHRCVSCPPVWTHHSSVCFIDPRSSPQVAVPGFSVRPDFSFLGENRLISFFWFLFPERLEIKFFHCLWVIRSPVFQVRCPKFWAPFWINAAIICEVRPGRLSPAVFPFPPCRVFLGCALKRSFF